MRSNDHAAAIVRSGDRIHVGFSHTPLTDQDISTAGAEEPFTRASRPVAIRVFPVIARTCPEAGEMHWYLSEPGRVPKDEERSSSEKVRRTI